MKQPPQRQTGAGGETLVSSYFEEIGCGPVGTGPHDLGTDLLVQLRTEDGEDSGLILGVQVKRGDSYFKRGELNGEEGYWFRTDQAHADHWRNHHSGHVCVLVSDDGSQMIWAPIDSESLVSTGKGWKVFIRSVDRLESTPLTAWFEVALRRQRTLSHRGMSWQFKISDLREFHWARTAMLVPRLVAPHANRGTSLDRLTWAEAAALCMRADSARWERLAQALPEVPTPKEARSHDDPGWRFASLVRDWAYGNCSLDDRRWTDLQSISDLTVPVRIIHALLLLEEGQPVSAAEYVAGNTPAVGLTDEDRGWLSLLRARFSQELSDWETAMHHLDAAEVALSRVMRDDLTVDALRAASVSARFNIRLTDFDIASFVTALDNPVTWWRSQQIGGALQSAIESVFRAWGNRSQWSIDVHGSAHNELTSASLTSSISGAWEQWRSVQGLLGKVDLILDFPNTADHLDALRRAGLRRDLVSAIDKLHVSGSMEPLVAFIEGLRPSTCTSSTLAADLQVVRRVQGVASEEWSDEWASTLADAVLGVSSLPMPRNARLDHEVLRALASVASHLEADRIEPLCWRLLELAKVGDQITLGSLESLAASITVPAEVRAALVREWRPDASPDGKKEVLMVLLRENPATRVHAGSLLEGGDLAGLVGIDRWDSLTEAESLAIVEALDREIGSLTSHETDDGRSLTIPATDRRRQLAAVALHGKAGDRGWEALIGFFANPSIYAGYKESAAGFLLLNASRVPDGWRLPLYAAVSAAVKQWDEDPWSNIGLQMPLSRSGDLEALEVALMPEDHDFWPQLLRLLANPARRLPAVMALGARPGCELLLVGLHSDMDPDVRDWACIGLTRRLLETPDPPSSWVHAICARLDQVGLPAYRSVTGVMQSMAISKDAVPGELRDMLTALEGRDSSSRGATDAGLAEP